MTLQLVRYGDQINLWSQLSDETSGFLGANGMLTDDLRLQHHEGVNFFKDQYNDDILPRDFCDCAFTIVPRYNFAAQVEYQRHQRTVAMRTKEHVGSDEIQQILEDKVKHEMEQNRKIEREKMGQPVLYGHGIILKHTRTGKYLTVVQGKGAKYHPSCLRVHLQPYGTSNSILTVMPRYRVRTEGERVYYSDFVMLKQAFHVISCEVALNTEHGSGKVVEVHANPDLDRFGWRIESYCPLRDTRSAELNYAQPIVLFHPETHSYVAAFANKHPLLIRKTHDQDPRNILSNMLFEWEHTDIRRGGDIDVTVSGRLRHVVTGRYLHIVSSETEQGGCSYNLELATERDASGAVLRLEPVINLGERNVRNGASMRLTFASPDPNESFYLGSEGDHSTEPIPTLEGTQEGSRDRFVLNVTGNSDADAFFLQLAPEELSSNAQFAYNAFVTISRVVTVMEEKGMQVNAAATATLNVALRQCVRFLLDKLAEPCDALTVRGSPVRRRQTVMRNTYVIEYVIRMLKLDIFSTTWAKTQKLRQDLALSLKLAYRFLFFCASEYDATQLYVAQNLNVFLTHLEMDVGAIPLLTCLLDNNKTLLREAIDKNILDLFAGFIANRGLSENYVEFLRALCSSRGEPVVTNQLLCLDMLRERYLTHFIETRWLEERGPVTSSKEEHHRIAGLLQKEQDQFDGRHVLEDGCWKLAVRWQFGTPGRTDPRELWGPENFVTIEGSLFLRLDSLLAPLFLSMDEQANNTTADIARFFVSQIRLFARMCLGRNYRCIEFFESLFRFEDIVSCMYDPKIPHLAKMAFTELAHYLYVDRIPRTQIIVPRMFRFETDISGWQKEILHADDHNKFRVLELYVSEHFAQHKDGMVYTERDLNKHTSKTLRLLWSLVQFGCFGTGSEVVELCAPLIHALDGRRDTVAKYHNTDAPTRYKLEASNWDSKTVFDSKTVMCATLLEINKFATDYRVSLFLKSLVGMPKMSLAASFASAKDLMELTATSDNSKANTEKAMREVDDDTLSKNLELQHINHDILVILMDLCQYQDFSLKKAAIKLFLSILGQRAEVVHALDNLQLIATAEEVGLQAAISSLHDLDIMIETHELWGDDATHPNYNECQKYLLAIRDCLQATPTDIWSRQDLLRNMGALSCLLKVIQIPWIPKEYSQCTGVDCELHKLFKLTISIMIQLVNEHDANQMETYAHVDTVVELLKFDLDAVRLLSAVFRNNEELVEEVTLHLIRKVCDILLTRTYDEAVLEFMQVVSVCKEKPQDVRQLDVLGLLLKDRERYKIQLFSGETCPLGIVMKRSVEGLQTTAEEKQMLEFHIKYIELLSTCCIGRNQIAETRCQKLYPLHDVSVEITRPTCTTGVRTVLMEFIRHAFIEVEIPVDEIWTAKSGFWMIVTWMSTTLTNSPVLTHHERDMFLRGCVPMLHAFIEKFDNYFEGYAEYLAMLGRAMNQVLTQCGWLQGEMRAMRFFGLLNDRLEKIGVGPLISMMPQPGSETPHSFDGFGVQIFGRKLSVFHSRTETIDETAGVTHAHSHSLLQKFDRNELAEWVKNEEQELLHFIKNIDSISQHISIFDDNMLVFTTKQICGTFVQVVSHDLNDDSVNLPLVRLLTTLVRSENPNYSDAYGVSMETCAQYQCLLVDCGCMNLVVDIVASSVDEDLSIAAYELGGVLLEGGNEYVQQHLYDYLVDDKANRSYSFVSAVRERLVKGAEHFTETAERQLISGEFSDIPDEFGVEKMLKFVEGMCEGQFQPLQEFLREQQGQSLNLLQDMTDFFRELVTCQHVQFPINEATFGRISQVIATLQEAMQGPCVANQNFMVFETAIVDICNSTILQDMQPKLLQPTSAHTAPKSSTLRTRVVLFLHSLVEGRSTKSLFQRLFAATDASILVVKMSSCYWRWVATRCGVPDALLLTDDDIADLNVSKFPNVITEHEEDDLLLQEGQEIHVLLRYLADNNDQLNEQLDALASGTSKSFRAWQFFARRTDSIEILKDDELDRIYFRKPRICDFLTQSTKENFLRNVSRNTPDEKVMDLLQAAPVMEMEMEHQYKLKKSKFFQRFFQLIEQLKLLHFFIAVAMNVIMIATYKTRGFGSDVMGEIILPRPSENALRLLGFIQIFVSAIVLLLHVTNSGPVHINSGWSGVARWIRTKSWKSFDMDDDELRKEHPLYSRLGGPLFDFYLFIARGTFHEAAVARERFAVRMLFHLTSLGFLLSDPLTLYYMFFLLFAIVGQTVSFLYVSVHVLDIAMRSETLKNVLRAVWNPRRQLSMTFLLGVAMIYVFTVYAFYFFRKDFWDADEIEEIDCDPVTNVCDVIKVKHPSTCSNLYTCFGATLNWGWRDGGGIGEYLNYQEIEVSSAAWWHRVGFDLTFYFLIIIILLNIIFGIVVDAFAALRDHHNKITFEAANKCFICSLPRYEFDHRGSGFNYHTETEHNLWSYVNFITYLHRKPRGELNGIELQCLELIEQFDLSWVPINKAMCFRKLKDDTTIEELKEELLSFQNTISSELRSISNRLEHLASKHV